LEVLLVPTIKTGCSLSARMCETLRTLRGAKGDIRG